MKVKEMIVFCFNCKSNNVIWGVDITPDISGERRDLYYKCKECETKHFCNDVGTVVYEVKKPVWSVS